MWINQNQISGRQFADPQLYLACAADSLHTNVLLITQDNKLRLDVEAINNQKSVDRDFQVKVLRLDEQGYLEPFLNPGEHRETNRRNETTRPIRPQQPPPIRQTSKNEEKRGGCGCLVAIVLGIYIILFILGFIEGIDEETSNQVDENLYGGWTQTQYNYEESLKYEPPYGTYNILIDDNYLKVEFTKKDSKKTKFVWEGDLVERENSGESDYIFDSTADSDKREKIRSSVIGIEDRQITLIYDSNEDNMSLLWNQDRAHHESQRVVLEKNK